MRRAITTEEADDAFAVEVLEGLLAQLLQFHEAVVDVVPHDDLDAVDLGGAEAAAVEEGGKGLVDRLRIHAGEGTDESYQAEAGGVGLELVFMKL